MIIGIGARRGVHEEEVLEAIAQALETTNTRKEDIEALASAELKKDEQGLKSAAGTIGVPIHFLSHSRINEIDVPSKSRASRFGLKGVAEPCALALSTNKNLIMNKKVYGRVTIAIAD
ncbi:cobalamin biosynthesis protein [Methanohalophilus sp. RSK]|uniref:cobalamin biosynthesis protein n=1 Tax=Methanohalophilus sp. RSK TaxID=2485783 RepID=UPI000F43E372|nr:cobalamin biosynthesis protein [Methanohalophilus sp. RSK]RNI14618.1 cobalamin biosynthesis protein [Methanohalophilus sp. RSK]